MARITIHDVAREAGVSAATVSRVLSESRPVAPDLAAAVRAACQRLGYRRNRIARSLRSRSTQTIGMIVPHIANPFFAAAVQAVERALRPVDQGLLLCDACDDPDLEFSHVRALLDRRVDGLLMIPCEAEASGRAVREAAQDVPVVQVDRWVAGVETDRVAVDNEAGIDATLAHLESIARRRPAFVGARPSISVAGERLEAYRRGVRRLYRSSEQVVLLGEFSVEWGRAATRELWTRPRPPDSLVCANDLIALGALESLDSLNVEVPAEVAVVGFDDIGFAGICHPPLTTVRQPVDAIGEEATRLLLSRIAGHEGPPRNTRLAPTLVIRASTRRPNRPGE